MAVVALTLFLLFVLCWLPFGAALAELLSDPAALLATASSPRVLGLLGSTVLLGLLTALAACLIGVPVGRLLARGRGRWVAPMALALPLPLVLPPWMVGVAWTSWFDLKGIFGATFLLAAALWPLVALFAMRGFRLAGHASDAAALTSGSRRRAFLKVELPLAAPSIASGALLVFVFAVTDFAVVDFLSFADPQPFVVLSSEIFQRWARLESSGAAAAVSLAAIVPTLIALALILRIEQRHQGRLKGAAVVTGRPLAPGPVGWGTIAVAALLVVQPIVVLVRWSFAEADPVGALEAARESAIFSVGVSLGAALIVAVGGVLVARLTLTSRRGGLLLGATLLPLAAPGVMFAVGEIRLWNHPANPLSDAVYLSPLLLVLTLGGRWLPLGVLAARALLLRLDEGPFDAGRLAGRPLWKRLVAVDLPLLAPATGMALVLGYVFSMRELDMIVLVPAGSATLAHRIFSMVHIASDGVTALLCVLLLGLVLVPAAAARLFGVPGVDCTSPGPPP